jgi:hypothetical protein
MVLSQGASANKRQSRIQFVIRANANSTVNIQAKGITRGKLISLIGNVSMNPDVPGMEANRSRFRSQNSIQRYKMS